MADYLAHCIIGMGGSWARGEDPDEAVRRCASIARSDWKHLYDMSGPLKIGLYDVDGHDQCIMGADGVFDADTGEPIDIMEVREA